MNLAAPAKNMKAAKKAIKLLRAGKEKQLESDNRPAWGLRRAAVA